MINHLALCTLDLGSNLGSNVPFFDDTTQYYMNISVGMFKYPSLMGIFPLPPPSPTAPITPINIISSYTGGSHGSFDPWVAPHPKDVESYGVSISLTIVDIFNPIIPSTYANTG
jgi:hypothetical protein